MAGFNNNAQLMGNIPASNTPIVVQIVGSGPQGIQGVQGKQGDPGKDGYTPIKGVDYFDGEKGDAYILTEQDKSDIAQLVPPYDDTEIKEEQARLSQSVSELDKTVYADEAVPINTTANSYYLSGTGTCIYNTRYCLEKYQVKSGDILYLHITAPNANAYNCAFQFQSAASVSQSNTDNLVGTPYSGNADGYFVVPDRAAWLIVSNVISDKYSNTVSRKKSNVSENSDEIKNLSGTVYEASVCKNLIGNDGRLYRTRELHTGDYIAFSTSDGLKSVTTREIEFYDKDGKYLSYYSLSTSASTRIISLAASVNGTCFIRLRNGSYGYDQKIQIEYGDKVTPYVEHFDNVRQLEDVVKTKADGVGAVPSFYEAHMLEKEAVIRNVAETHNIADAFVFLTDYHDISNSGNSPQLVNSILKNTGVRGLVFGGDCLNTTYDKDVTKNRILDVRNAFDFAENKFYIIGNHEYNDPNGTQTSKRLNASEVYSLLCNRQSLMYEASDGVDYSVINRSAKIYYIMMGCTYSASISNAQITWLCEELQKVPSGYAVMVISHIGLKDLTNPVPSNTDMVNVLAALKNKSTFVFNGETYSYTNDVAVIGILSGHTHWDAAVVSNGINVISTTCDAYKENYELVNGVSTKVARNRGTVEDQAFDVVQIDLAGRQLIITRIGYGEDRNISF